MRHALIEYQPVAKFIAGKNNVIHDYTLFQHKRHMAKVKIICEKTAIKSIPLIATCAGDVLRLLFNQASNELSSSKPFT